MAALEGNLVTPTLLGRSMELNPNLVFVSLAFWGWMLGVGGALLAVPLLAIMKLIDVLRLFRTVELLILDWEGRTVRWRSTSSGLGWFLEQTNTGRDAEQQLLQVLSHYLSPTLSEHAAHALAQVRDQASIGGPLGFIALLFAAMTFFAHFERAFDRIWNVDDPESTNFLSAVRSILTRRLLAFCMLMALGAILFAIFVVGIAIDAFKSHSAALLPIPDWIVRLSQAGLTVGLNALIFTAIYRWLPKTIVSWKEAAYGGIAAAVTWEIGRQLLASWLIGSKFTSAYGVVGSFIAILLWSYYSITVVLMGAEFIQTICRACSDTKNRR